MCVCVCVLIEAVVVSWSDNKTACESPRERGEAARTDAQVNCNFFLTSPYVYSFFYVCFLYIYILIKAGKRDKAVKTKIQFPWAHFLCLCGANRFWELNAALTHFLLFLFQTPYRVATTSLSLLCCIYNHG